MLFCAARFVVFAAKIVILSLATQKATELVAEEIRRRTTIIPTGDGNEAGKV